MLDSEFNPGDDICWRNRDDVWHHGTVVAAENGHVEVEDAIDGTRTRIDAGEGRISPPTLPFRTNAHAKDDESRVFLHAVADAVEELGIPWDDVGFMWSDDTPMVMISSSVPESLRNTLRIEVNARTPERIVPKIRACETLQP